jgi:hypothetical protein
LSIKNTGSYPLLCCSCDWHNLFVSDTRFVLLISSMLLMSLTGGIVSN